METGTTDEHRPRITRKTRVGAADHAENADRLRPMTHRHMSMLRSYTPADALTIGNAACGTIAIFLCLNYLAEGERRFLWTAF
jgi:hypothetical protein